MMTILLSEFLEVSRIGSLSGFYAAYQISIMVFSLCFYLFSIVIILYGL